MRFYQLLAKKNRVNIVTLTLGGVFVADIPMLLIWPLANGEGSVSFAVTVQLFSAHDGDGVVAARTRLRDMLRSAADAD